jgi:hypothetical protein
MCEVLEYPFCCGGGLEFDPLLCSGTGQVNRAFYAPVLFCFDGR